MDHRVLQESLVPVVNVVCQGCRVHQEKQDYLERPARREPQACPDPQVHQDPQAHQDRGALMEREDCRDQRDLMERKERLVPLANGVGTETRVHGESRDSQVFKDLLVGEGFLDPQGHQA